MFAIGLNCVIPSRLIAQNDTVRLAPATIYGYAPERFMTGLKVQKIDSTTLAQFYFRNITDLLSLNTPVFFKNYGPGQLSTVAFRGSSANHTAVLWNGLNINLPTLGQTDFSTIPVAGFDQLSVQYGSAGSIAGTDAVGGSILFGSVAPQKGLSINLGRQQGSFSNAQTQGTIRYGIGLKNGWNLSGKTAAYDSQMKNHYKHPLRNGELINPSETFQKGLVQDLFLTNKKQQISAHLWLTESQLTNNPKNLAGREYTGIKSYRSMLRYEVGKWTARTAWVRDVIDYGTGDYAAMDHGVTDRLNLNVEHTFDIRLGQSVIQAQAGGSLTFYKTQVINYEKPVIRENREDFYLLTRWQPNSKLLFSANLRQALVTGYNPPFTPSIGGEYKIIQTATNALKLRGSVGKSYRVPTLNERYWKNLGNPDIQPENSFNKEIGLEGNRHVGQRDLISASISAYHNKISNWAYWNPANNFRVENLQLVVARGLEAQLGWKTNATDWSAGSNLNYALTKTSQEKLYDAYAVDIVGKQLPHIPVHTGNWTLFLKYKKTKVTNQLLLVSKRFTTSDHTTLSEGYILENLLLETIVSCFGIDAVVQGRVDNLTNSFYRTVNGNPMPGRSFAVSLLFSFKTGNNSI